MKKKLLLLHGALGSKARFRELEQMLSGELDVYSINFSGHGGRAILEEPFSIELFANDALSWMKENKFGSINIFGYSMGGYVALYLARHYPEKIGKVFTLATKFKWNEEVSAGEKKILDPQKIKEKIPAFAEELKNRHAPQSWESVLEKTKEMMINLGKNNTLKPEDFKLIINESIIGIGDRDKMVTLEETIDVYRNLRNGRLLVLTETPHPFENIKTERLFYEINNFF